MLYMHWGTIIAARGWKVQGIWLKTLDQIGRDVGCDQHRLVAFEYEVLSSKHEVTKPMHTRNVYSCALLRIGEYSMKVVCDKISQL